MNGQMYQLCSIVAASKRALQSNESIQYTLEKYENLSNELLQNIRLAILYAINEW